MGHERAVKGRVLVIVVKREARPEGLLLSPAAMAMRVLDFATAGCVGPEMLHRSSLCIWAACL